MIAVLEGGTDAASMLIFDPAMMPDNYDEEGHRGPMDVIERLFDEGRIYWLNTASDGSFSLGLYSGERLSDGLAGFARALGVAARFAVVSGRIYFTGVEYAFHHDDSRLRKYPHMGACCEVPKGTYRLNVFEMEYLAREYPDYCATLEAVTH
jgi:hypothetical protein